MTREKDRIPTRAQLTLNLKRELKEKLEQISEIENRSLNGQIVHVLEGFVKKSSYDDIQKKK